MMKKFSRIALVVVGLVFGSLAVALFLPPSREDYARFVGTSEANELILEVAGSDFPILSTRELWVGDALYANSSWIVKADRGVSLSRSVDRLSGLVRSRIGSHYIYAVIPLDPDKLGEISEPPNGKPVAILFVDDNHDGFLIPLKGFDPKHVNLSHTETFQIGNVIVFKSTIPRRLSL